MLLLMLLPAAGGGDGEMHKHKFITAKL